MKPSLLPLLLLLNAPAAALAQTPAAPAATHQPTNPATHLTGTVRDADGQPLPGVNVFVKTSFDGASTDSLGRFSFSTDHAAGPAVLVATFIGYEPLETLVTLGEGPISLPNLRLKASRAALGDVVVTAGAFEASDEKRSSVLKPLDIVTTAGALGDIAGALNALPGTTRNGETGQLFVRGGAASETKTYLDGLPVQTPYGGAVPNVAARGRFSPFLFKGTVFSTGGYSAEYGQALSAVVALNSTDLAPETLTSVSLMSVGGSLARTKRWDCTSLALTGDYTNLAPYYNLVPQNLGWEKAPLQMGGSLKLAHKVGEAGMLKVYGTYSRQRLALRQPDANPEFAATGHPVALANDNIYLNTTYRAPLTRGWSLNTGLALTQDDNLIQPDVQTVHDLDRSAVARLVLTNDSASNWFNLKMGVEGYAQRYRQHYQPAAEAPTLSLGVDEQRGAAFAESEMVLSHNLAGRAGLRTEYSALLGRFNAAPRLGLAYKTGENSQLSAAWGYFYQTPTTDLLRISHALQFERAEHYMLTYQRMVKERTLRAEIYQKNYAQLTTFSAAQPYNPTTYQNAGSGYARGLDVLWRDRTTFKKADYWVSYDFVDTRRQFRDYPEQAVPTFTARHNLSVVGKYWLQKIHTQVGFTYAYGSPRRYNDPNLPGYNQGSLPAYQDLSLNASYLTHWFGQFTIVYVSASNVLGRQNVYGYTFAGQPDASGLRPSVAVLPPAPRMLFVGVFISINKTSKVDLNEKPE
ncbi:TonB-dependent receptor [Hymenobacter properus]|uniref:TonB-dependent receptor n=1 Tax=Hymenobacter properus TaxID=2791026 RepID=A0A931FKT4_9BACT|nr:TonB-dependent receptor [Hymenobacter properus]MBF9144267.1 TonB-dependent receptor [Hymenobacter properus]MBR7723085.1 TonB-dependent receptor [Microvirga sp. SRT04]